MQKDDLISRQMAIDAIDEIESEVADGDGFQYDKWRQFFCDLPSEDVPERKVGKWIRKYDYCNGIIMRVCKCSACGANAGIGEDGFWYKSNFCPNCGAEMRGEDDG